MSVDPTYNKDYYRENKEEILRKRREKYHSDQEYRRRVLDRAKKYHKKHRIRRSFPPGIYVSHGGEKYFRASFIARMLNKHIQTLYYYKRQGVLPATGYSTAGGRELYSKKQAKTLRRVFRAHVASDSLKAVAERIKQEWEHGGDVVVR